MKKFLALMLSVLMLLTMTAAFAEDGETTAALTADCAFTKQYVGAIPEETLTFNVEFVEELVTGSTVAPAGVLPETITLNTAEATANGMVFNVPFTANAPADKAYGSYIYKITEAEGTNDNVTYDSEDALYLVVAYTVNEETGAEELAVSLIEYKEENAEGASLEASDRAIDTDVDEDTKKDQFVNEYALGAFDVTKTITGNAANLEDKFVVEVSFTAQENLDGLTMTYISSEAADDAEPTAVGTASLTAGEAFTMQITIGHEETISFANVPVGVAIKITELKQDGKDDLNYYTPSYTNQEITVTEEIQTMSITNTKTTEIPTGVELDSIPYIVLMAVAVLGAVAFIVKRRMAAAADED